MTSQQRVVAGPVSAKKHNGILLFTYQEQTQDQTIWYVQITILVCFNLVNIKMIIYGPVSACTYLSYTNTRTKSMKLCSKFFNEKYHLWGRGLHSHLHHRHLVSTNVEILQKKYCSKMCRLGNFVVTENFCIILRLKINQFWKE